MRHDVANDSELGCRPRGLPAASGRPVFGVGQPARRHHDQRQRFPTAAGKDGQDLLVKYKDGEKKVIIPPGTPIAKYVPGTPADLKVGDKIFVGADAGP